MIWVMAMGYFLGLLNGLTIVWFMERAPRRISKRGCNRRFSRCLACEHQNRCDRYSAHRKRADKKQAATSEGGTA
jgi:hypothetical protein